MSMTETAQTPTTPSATAALNERKAFEGYYRLYRLFVFDQCCRRFSNREDARDLESLVWTEVLRFFDKFQGDDPRRQLAQLIGWRAKDLYRQKYRTVQEVQGLEVEDSHLIHLMEQGAGRELPMEDRLSLQQVLAKETPQDRRILFGRYVEGRSWEELSTTHELHRNTLLKRTKAALQRLRRRLQELSPSETAS